MDGKDYSIYTGITRSFSIADYIVFAVTMFFSMAIGFHYAYKDRKNKSSDEYLMGSRNIAMVPVAMSLLVTHLSAVTIMGIPAEVYNYNTMYWWICGGYVIAITGSALVTIPFFHKLQVTSVNEYLEMRFGSVARVICSMSLLVGMIIHCGFVLYAPSLALNVVTGLHLWGSIALIISIVTIYTTLGGMKAVVMTDTLQGVIIVVGMLAVLIQGCLTVGGFSKAWQVADNKGRIVFNNLDPNPTTRHSVWSLVFGGGFFWWPLFGMHQAQVQRALSCRSLNDSKRALWLCLLGMIVLISLGCMIGIVMFAFYSDCDPVKFKGLISRSDQLLPLFVMDVLGKFPGLPGLFVTCVFSGSLSSLSSSMSAAPALILQDFIKPVCCGNISEGRATVISKFVVVLFGFLAFIFAYTISQLGSVLEASYRLGSLLSGPLFGLFIVGMFFPWTNKVGALVGWLAGVIFSGWIVFGAYVHKIFVPHSAVSTEGCNWNISSTTVWNISTLSSWNISSPILEINSSIIRSDDTSDPFVDMYRLSYLWYGGSTVAVQIVVSLIVSFATGYTKPSSLDPKLICTFFDYVCPCLPESVLKFLRFGLPKAKELTEGQVQPIYNDSLHLTKIIRKTSEPQT